MKLVRIGTAGREAPAILHDGAYLDISAITEDISGEFLERGGIQGGREVLDAGLLPPIEDAASQRLGHPSRGRAPSSASA